jgi:hypothetical protein
MKPYLISLASDTKGMPRFLDSLKHIRVEHINIQFTPYYNTDSQSIFTKIPYPGHILKYKWFPRNLDPNRYIIYTDTDDVVFQKELPEFTHDLYLSAENVPTHKDTWWESHIRDYPDHRFDSLLDKPVYCSGTWATRVGIFYEYLDFLERMGAFEETKHFSDQLYFNLFLNKYKSVTKKYEELDLFCSLHANIHRNDVVKDNEVWKYRGEVITCVHSNGSTKEAL